MFEKKPIFPAIWLALIMDVSSTWMLCIFWIEILVFIYKGVCLPYAAPYFGIEITFYIIWGLTTLLRNKIGDHGLARCEPKALVFYLIITLFTILCCNLYFVNYQAYILRIDLILNAFCMAVECLEAILALVCTIAYARKQAI